MFWTILVENALALRSPYLLIGYGLVFALGRSKSIAIIANSSLGRRTLRGSTIFLVGHLLAMLLYCGLSAGGYDSLGIKITALAFELLCITSLASHVVFAIALPRMGLAVPRILTDIITAIAFVIVMIIVGKRAGFSVAGLITTSAVLTAVIGFALQDTLGNMMGGLALQMDNSVKAGDWISLGPGQPQGQVSEIRWRYTAIETRSWETILIPNGNLMRSQVTILGRRTDEPTQWRRQFDFCVDFRTPPNDVITAVHHSLAKDQCDSVAQTPAPHVVLSTFRDSTAQYTLRYWLTDLGRDEVVDSDLRRRLWYVLARANIKLSIPANAAFVTRNDDEHHLRKTVEDTAKRKAALRSIDLFSTMSDELISELAPQVAYTPFSAGETITAEGEFSNGLYLVVQGQAAVLINAPGATGRGTEREVARLDAGQFFGEMSLMTGEVRSATVRATTDLVCYRVDKASFEKLLRNAPYLADQIADVLATRREVLTSARDERDDDKQRRIASVKQDLVTRIRGFFSLDNDKEKQ